MSEHARAQDLQHAGHSPRNGRECAQRDQQVKELFGGQGGRVGGEDIVEIAGAETEECQLHESCSDADRGGDGNHCAGIAADIFDCAAHDFAHPQRAQRYHAGLGCRRWRGPTAFRR